MPKSFSEREKEIIRARMLAKGKELFARYGPKKTSVEELTRAAGISKGAFYIFFSSKEELFLEVLEQYEAEFRRTLLAYTPEPGRSFRQGFADLMRLAFSTWRSHPLLEAVTGQEYEALLRRLPEERVLAHIRSDDVFVAELVARWQSAGAVIGCDPGTIAGLMYALCFVSLHEGDFGPDVYPGTMEVLIDLVAGYVVRE